MSIKEQLSKLVELQAIDAEIYRLRGLEQQGIPQQLKKYNDDLLERRKHLTEMEEKLKTVQLEKKNKELDLQTKENNVKKFQLQLCQVKTNKQYTSLEKEIEGLKADNSLLEEAIIHLLDELDLVSERSQREKKEFEEESKRVTVEEEKLKQELEQIKQKIGNLEVAREERIQQVDPKILPRYERVLKLRHGTAVVPVRDGSCQGCFMNLPPQEINLVQASEDWVVCEQCARILYIESEV